MLEIFADPQVWIALGTLVALEIVLGIDNIIFISILVGRLPESQRNQARTIGLGLAMISRILLLLSLNWVLGLTEPLFSVAEFDISGRDLIMLLGGLFLLGKSTHEIHHSLEGEEDGEQKGGSASYAGILIQIAVIDIVFSLDSVITAVGLAEQVIVMIIAVVISVLVMMFAAKSIGEFVDKHPTVKMLALSFLILVGVTLIAEGMAVHIPKGYIYFAMAFSITVEMLNIKMRKNRKPVVLRKSISEDPSQA